MNFKKFAIGAGIAAAMAFASSAYAQNLLFTNGSASTLDGLYISDSGSGNWEENLLGGQRLAPGEQIQINIQGTYGKFDLMVSSGSASEEYYEYPGSTTQITIHGARESDYQ